MNRSTDNQDKPGSIKGAQQNQPKQSQPQQQQPQKQQPQHQQQPGQPMQQPNQPQHSPQQPGQQPGQKQPQPNQQPQQRQQNSQPQDSQQHQQPQRQPKEETKQHQQSLPSMDEIKGDWKQKVGAAKIAWGKLTEDEILQSEGQAQRLAGIVQERYAITRDEAEKQVKSFFEKAKDAVK